MVGKTKVPKHDKVNLLENEEEALNMKDKSSKA
jgi:hypothetical protein